MAAAAAGRAAAVAAPARQYQRAASPSQARRRLTAKSHWQAAGNPGRHWQIAATSARGGCRSGGSRPPACLRLRARGGRHRVDGVSRTHRG